MTVSNDFNSIIKCYDLFLVLLQLKALIKKDLYFSCYAYFIMEF